MDNNGQRRGIADALFRLDGDNVYFRGVDTGLKWGDYDCPLFGSWVAKSVAKYISTDARKIKFDAKSETFVLTIEGDTKSYLVRSFEIDGKTYYDFGRIAPWKKS